jgi:hypothetical protein
MTAVSPSFIDPAEVVALKARLHWAFVAMHGVELEAGAPPTSSRAHEAGALLAARSSSTASTSKPASRCCKAMARA